MEISQNDCLNDRNYNIDVKFNMVQDRIKVGTITVIYVPFASMDVVVLTMLLTKDNNRANRLLLGMNVTE